MSSAITETADREPRRLLAIPILIVVGLAYQVMNVCMIGLLYLPFYYLSGKMFDGF